ncbi:ABC-2 family transporter protein [Streptomyces zhaozhouensis]|uniref:ABC-2 family transporter protein n=1 Tax=Streptomyces zhaozhouensis TaxID=1300267 RepID=A0A286E0N7_9ACTN|nr:ABC transporter permease [Streptomyces zhaozhouensis]SOD64466.1 ABC-2 family transporter protein [Streptomyces zhaozhouensis]
MTTTTTQAPVPALPRLEGSPTGGGSRGAFAFEWTKLTSVRATWWNLLAALVLTVGFAGMLGLSAEASSAKGVAVDEPAHRLAAQAFLVSQLALVALATLAVTSEYAGGTAHATLRAVPRRGRLLAAKTTVVALVVGAAGTVLQLAGGLTAGVLMGGGGTGGDGSPAATALAVGGHLALLAVLSVGLAFVLRSAAGALTSLIMLLLALPQLLGALGPGWLATASDHLPGVAGEALTAPDGAPYGAARAVLVLVGWALAAQLAALVTLRRRDA